MYALFQAKRIFSGGRNDPFSDPCNPLTGANNYLHAADVSKGLSRVGDEMTSRPLHPSKSCAVLSPDAEPKITFDLFAIMSTNIAQQTQEMEMGHLS